MFFLNISAPGKRPWDGSLPLKRGVQVLTLLVLFSGMAWAQFTTVTGTVTDPDTVPYANGTIAAKLILTGAGSPTLNGLGYSPPIQPAGLDSNGKFTLSLADNTVLLPAGTKWNFTICSAIGTVNPAFGTASQCFSLPSPITISGSSQDITANITAAPVPRLTVPFGAGSGTVTTNPAGGCVTNNSLAKFTGALVIGCSSWTDDGTTTTGTDTGGISLSAAPGGAFVPIQTTASAIELRLNTANSSAGGAAAVHAFGGQNSAGTNNGADLAVQGGLSASGGSVVLTGGNSSANPAGNITLIAGNNTGGGAKGGDIGLSPGTGTGSNGVVNCGKLNGATCLIKLFGKTSGNAVSLTVGDSTNSYTMRLPTGGTELAGGLLVDDGGGNWSFSGTSTVITAANTPSTFNAAGTIQNAPHIVQDTCTLGTNCAVTLSGSAAFTSSSSYHCTATDATAANAVRANQTSGSAVTFTGTGTDVINFICIGT